jgi:hypothetical protein
MKPAMVDSRRVSKPAMVEWAFVKMCHIGSACKQSVLRGVEGVSDEGVNQKELGSNCFGRSGRELKI